MKETVGIGKSIPLFPLKKNKCDINAGEISKMHSWDLEDKLL